MKIGLALERLDPARGGVEQWTWQYAQRLAALGHEVHVVAAGACPQAAEQPFAVHLVPWGRNRLEFAGNLARRFDRLPLDVVHDTGCGWQCDVLQPHSGSRQAGAAQNIALAPAWLRPFKRAAARFLPRQREFARLEARQYADPRRTFVAISQMVARDLARWHGVPAERIRLVYNGVDPQRFEPEHDRTRRTALRTEFGLSADDVALLIVAHNFRLKGVPALLRALARLVAQGGPFKLLVAGGKRLGPWRRAAARLGLGERVNFLGSVADPAPLYAAADVYVQPTFYDPCSLVVLEALAAGLPVVTTRCNGAGELIQEGGEGYVLPDPADDAALAAALWNFRDADLRQVQGQAARRLALHHTWDRNTAELLQLYRERLGPAARAA